jgi:hypothetical protein
VLFQNYWDGLFLLHQRKHSSPGVRRQIPGVIWKWKLSTSVLSACQSLDRYLKTPSSRESPMILRMPECREVSLLPGRELSPHDTPLAYWLLTLHVCLFSNFSSGIAAPRRQRYCFKPQATMASQGGVHLRCPIKVKNPNAKRDLRICQVSHSILPDAERGIHLLKSHSR